MIMSTASNNYSSFKKCEGLITFFYRYRAASSAGPSFATQRNFRNHFLSSTYNKHGCYTCINSGLIRFITATATATAKPAGSLYVMVKDEDNKVQQERPPSQNSCFSTWAKCILSSVVAIWLSFSQKWRRLLVLEEEVEKVVEEVEEVAEEVDKVATATEKMSAEVAEKIPDNSLMKEAALLLEHVSTIAASDAQLTKDFVHKVEDVKQDLEDLKTMAEPLVDKIKQLKIQDGKQ